MVRYHEIIKEDIDEHTRICNFLYEYYDIDPDKIVFNSDLTEIEDYNDNLKVQNNIVKDVERLPNFKILSVEQDFDIKKTNLKTLENSPEKVKGVIRIINNTQLVSLKGLPLSETGILYIVGNPNLKSLEGIEKHPIFMLSLSYSSTLPLLRTLLITGNITFRKENGVPDQDTKPISDIINHHIKTYSDINERIYMCREELKEKGYRGNARW
jgi:hypothetical protein